MKNIEIVTIILGAVAVLFAAVFGQAESDMPVQPVKIKLKATTEMKPGLASIPQAPALTGSKQGYRLVTDVLDGLGRASSSTNYRMPVNSGGQTAPGASGSTNYRMKAGFVHSTYVYRGDANADAVIDVGDVVYLINYLFKSGPVPSPLEAGDVNCDGNVDVGDVVYLINYLFKGGPPPAC
ncbi:MAG TPA: dockerin type I repeat-containing protein [candidate division Zixibacteria bacterium]